MHTFKQYINNEKEDEKLRDECLEVFHNKLVEKKRKVEVQKEMAPSGWDIFHANQDAVENYIDWIQNNEKV